MRMLEILDRGVGTVVGLIFGSIYCVAILGLALIHTVGATWLLLRDILLQLLIMTEKLLNLFFRTLRESLNNPFLLVFSVLEFVLVKIPLLLITTLVNILSSMVKMGWDILQTLGICLIVAIAQPFVAFMQGLLHGIKKAIFYPFEDPESPDDANIQELLNQGMNNHLPVNVALTRQRQNRELAEKINLLPASLEHQALRIDEQKLTQLKNNPAQAQTVQQYQQINKDNICSISQSDLLEIEQPVTVEYQGSNNQWYSKVFETADFLRWMNRASGYAFLPENRISLTAAGRQWKQEIDNGKPVLKSSDGKMKIYAGIPTRLKEELDPLVRNLHQAMDPPANNASRLFTPPPSVPRRPSIDPPAAINLPQMSP